MHTDVFCPTCRVSVRRPRRPRRRRRHPLLSERGVNGNPSWSWAREKTRHDRWPREIAGAGSRRSGGSRTRRRVDGGVDPRPRLTTPRRTNDDKHQLALPPSSLPPPPVSSHYLMTFSMAVVSGKDNKYIIPMHLKWEPP